MSEGNVAVPHQGSLRTGADAEGAAGVPGRSEQLGPEHGMPRRGEEGSGAADSSAMARSNPRSAIESA